MKSHGNKIFTVKTIVGGCIISEREAQLYSNYFFPIPDVIRSYTAQRAFTRPCDRFAAGAYFIKQPGPALYIIHRIVPVIPNTDAQGIFSRLQKFSDLYFVINTRIGITSVLSEGNEPTVYISDIITVGRQDKAKIALPFRHIEFIIKLSILIGFFHVCGPYP